MKRIALLVLAAVLLGALPGSDAEARDGYPRHHRHHRPHVGVFIGAPLLFAPWVYGSPYRYYPPAVVTVPAAPPVYIEQGSIYAPPPESGYWYYCGSGRGYYPAVRDCPEGWQRVLPQPPR